MSCVRSRVGLLDSQVFTLFVYEHCEQVLSEAIELHLRVVPMTVLSVEDNCRGVKESRQRLGVRSERSDLPLWRWR